MTASVPPSDAVATPPKYRPVPLGGSLEARFRTEPDGSVVVTSTEPLGAYADRLTDRLLHWAEVAPDRTLVAKRVAGGDWRRVSYAEALAAARSIAQALLDRGLSAERPVAILSDNDIEHLLLGLGAMLAGIPFAPVSAAYSLLSQDFEKLRHILGVLTPGLVFAANGSAFAKAIGAVVPADTPVVLTEGALPGRATTAFDALLATVATDAVDAAHAQVGPETIAKFLFTSGSTKLPKGVVNTQRMLCSNQQMIRQCFRQLIDEPPVLLDWLPWNHTFGGNHNVGIAIYNGGTLYIDDGKPTPALIGETLRNLREIAPTLYFNVPKGFEEIAHALEGDAQLRETFFSRVRMLFFAGAGLSQPVWDQLDRIAAAHAGERIKMLTGLGMTETSPFATCANAHEVKSGHVGLPAPGLELKLVPSGDKMEVRYRGPNVTPGYWRAPEQTADAFDADGYYCSGDALKPMDAAHPERGFLFDGRIAEDFKLATGTFVSVGPLRARVVAGGDPCVQDAVIAGINRNDIGVLIFPRLDACRSLAGLAPGAQVSDVLAAPPVRAFFQRLVDALYASGTGSATRVARAMLLATPPSIDRGEITDKGSLNQRAVLTHRAAAVDALYDGQNPQVILAQPPSSPDPPDMNIEGQSALVTGGASGLGAQTARALAARGAKVAVLDRNGEGAKAVAAEIGGIGIACDITSTESVVAALAAARAAHGPARILMNVAGIGTAKRLIGKDGTPMPLEDFKRVVDVNLVGTFNVTRLAAAEIVKLEPLADDANSGERGVIVNTASVAAFDGQVGQEAYAASKGGIVALTLPLARDLAQFGIRVMTIAPGLFLTPLMAELPQSVQESLAASIPFPRRLGRPDEFARLALQIVENVALNGEVIRLDGALRMAPR